MTLCKFCIRCLEGIHDPAITPRLGLRAPTPTADTETENKPAEIEKYIYGHHRQPGSWSQSSVEEKCIICGEMSFPEGDNDVFIEEERVNAISYVSIFELDIEKDVLIMSLRWKRNVTKITLAPVNTARGMENLFMKLDGTTDGPGVRELARRWVEECTNHHRRCLLHDLTASFIPTRLLEINNKATPATFRLVLRSECQKDTRYIALSHVWGGGPVEEKLRLLGSTYKGLRQERSINELPGTFHDAMIVALRLGVYYIWIDSLCIVQDSKEDWQTEAATMQDVYRHAYVTISALSGTNEHAGLFYKRNPEQFTTAVAKIKLSACGKASMYYRAADEWRSRFRPFFRDNILIERAWCFQERRLSPRVLHFGALQVFWECHEMTASETVRNSFSFSSSQRILWKPTIEIGLQNSYSGDAWDSILQEWYDTVHSYSGCKLTFASDKLVAIAGLANDMRRILQENWPDRDHIYLAGLWEADLRNGLCWSTYGKGRPSTYLAPSWSWASLDTEVRTEMIERPTKTNPCHWFVSEHECIAHTEYAGQSDTGQVSGGTLVLTGPIVDLRTQIIYGEWLMNDEYVVHGFMDHMTGARLDIPTRSSHGRPHSTLVEFDAHVARKAVCIPMRTMSNPERERKYQVFGLLLAPVEGTDDVYKRIGALFAWFDTQEIAIQSFETLPKKRVTVI